MTQQVVDAKIKVGGQEVASSQIFDFSVELDLDTPDMAEVRLANQGTSWSSQTNLGDPIEISAGYSSGFDSTIIFKGDVTGVEPEFRVRGPARVRVRALNAMHRLARGKKSVSWTRVSDRDMVTRIAGRYGLSPDFAGNPPTSQMEHIYQHNQTDLEFLRMRASRIGYEVLVDDRTLIFRQQNQNESGIRLTLGEPGRDTLESFLPRLSTANQVSEVRVRGWDPDRKAEIIGVARPQNSRLGDTTGSAAASRTFQGVQFVDVDVPVQSKEEADALARSLLQDRLMNYIQAEGSVRGHPELKPGMIIEIVTGEARFSGKYYLTAVQHRYVHTGSDHGFRTHFKCRRDAESGGGSGGGAG